MGIGERATMFLAEGRHHGTRAATVFDPFTPVVETGLFHTSDGLKIRHATGAVWRVVADAAVGGVEWLAHFAIAFFDVA